MSVNQSTNQKAFSRKTEHDSTLMTMTMTEAFIETGDIQNNKQSNKTQVKIHQ